VTPAIALIAHFAGLTDLDSPTLFFNRIGHKAAVRSRSSDGEEVAYGSDGL